MIWTSSVGNAQSATLCTPGAYVTGGATPAGAAVNFRAAPALDAPIFAKLTINAPVMVLGATEGALLNDSAVWCRVVVNQVEGYIHSAFLVVPPTPTPTLTAAPAATSSPTPEFIVLPFAAMTHYVIQEANVRSCPRRDCENLGTLAAGTTITADAFVNGERIRADNDIWYRVIYNNRQAYVYSSLLSATPPIPTMIPVPTQSFSTIPESNSFSSCPANCTEARAWGVSAERAAACGLDRDGDGVACYND